jgi:hypothetical protein
VFEVQRIVSSSADVQYIKAAVYIYTHEDGAAFTFMRKAWKAGTCIF